MKFVISKDTAEVEYKSNAFWKQFDEVEVESPVGWYLHYISGGIVHVFDYCQSTGRGDFTDEYREETYAVPLHFTDNAKSNAEIMHKLDYDNMKAVLVQKK